MLIGVLDQSLEKSPFFDCAHRDGAASYIVLNHMFMPYRYGDQTEEYWALVNDATLWDVAAERQVEISGPDAEAFLELLVPRSLKSCAVGQCRYVVITDNDGYILNDPVLNRLDSDRYWLSAADSDLLLWAKGVACFAGMDVKIAEPEAAPIQIQGNKSRDIMVRLFGEKVADLKYYHLIETEFDGMPLMVTRTGWSGDLGYEIYLRDTSRAAELWDRVKEAGKPSNLRVTGPNTIRRVEAGIIAMRSDFPARSTPFHVGLERLVDLDKPVDFIGKSALRRIATEGVSWKLVGLEFEEGAATGEAAAFGGRVVSRDGVPVGRTTVVVHSPRLKRMIGYARIDAGASGLGTLLSVAGKSGDQRARVAKRPFFDAGKREPRR
ncbi:glycine cleavage T C-terminal barrel domain-containing protein [Taklimakanibacter lacteus]|uniref:glycine cleavage T C-terminal barrel domain-containing protein n=1 Tax=Taklimakanibacter lacteus TaxID=2268456 RepID=UPI0013C3FB42